MTLSGRDKKILSVLVPVLVLVVYWFLLLSPKREEAATASATLETEQMALADAETRATTAVAAKASFARDYAAVVRLGKAIPTTVDMPSLLVQLEQAARGTGIEFRSVTAGERETVASTGGATAAAPAPDGAAQSPGTAPSGEPPQSGAGEAAAAAQDTADAASPAPPASDQAPAAPAAAGTAPAAGSLESVSLEFSFEGSFFELANFFHRLKRFVYVDGENVRVRGRLMAIETVEYVSDPETFPALTANVTASVFLTPQAQGETAGATPSGPAPAAPNPAAAGAAPAPAPAATVTP